jgi:transposase
MRCLRRRLSDVVYRELVADAAGPASIDDNADPGGHSEATVPSSATDLTPDIGSSDQPQPGPAPTTLITPRANGKTTGRGTADDRRRRTGGVNVERPTGRTTLTPTSVGAHSTSSPAPSP